jgi:RNA polymerase sigma-70 factor (ECF subfamily)
LVRSARRGDLGAFEVLVGRYQRQATAVAYRLLNNREDAMDVVQDAFLRAYDKLGTLSHPGRFGSWLLRIVSNLSLNFRRSRALRRMAPLELSDEDEAARGFVRADPHAPDPAAVASASEMRGLLARAISQLPEMQRQALVLFCIEKLPQKEIAGMLGCSVEAVKWHVFAARRKLKERFKDYL